MRTFSFKNCVALPDIKISIVLAFPNLEELAVSSIQDLWESGGEFETILGRDYPFTKLKLLEVVDIRGPQWKEVSNWDTACTWIKRGVKPKNRDEKEAVTNAYATLNQGQQQQQQQEQLTEGGVVLCTEFSYPHGQYLSQEGIRVRHVRMRPSNNVRIETLWLPCCRQLETLSLSTAGRAHFPSHLLSVGMKLDRPLNQDTVIKHLPWMETLTSLHLRGRGNESPVWTKWMREILLMMKALNDFMLLEPMSDLALFEGMGRDRVRMIELGQGQDLTQETEGQLHGDERDMRFERPFLKRLTIRRASSATSTIAQWEGTLWRQFRFLEVLDVDDESNADVA
ncbi:hypothetical protein BGZ99_005073 [Dissophora globulifera]|uniref:Uncharacterized protein n=1 Tax=Dissophora globulifera TaxID=979702 RepID=A0A9P6RG33_9FUNG|nr:hypothetical protein BGZ99_005073 [Dissophora globulifera]